MKLSSLADVLDGPFAALINSVMAQLLFMPLQGSVDMGWEPVLPV
ncbi:hypothetical protein [Prescottella subtropica]|nr:hypothetical protein [Prescottella subtropica]